MYQQWGSHPIESIDMLMMQRDTGYRAVEIKHGHIYRSRNMSVYDFNSTAVNKALCIISKTKEIKDIKTS